MIKYFVEIVVNCFGYGVWFGDFKKIGVSGFDWFLE